MSDENQETIADIVAEMRNLGKIDEKSPDKIQRSLMGLGLRTYADRIEAAAKREKELCKAYWTQKCRDTIPEHDRYCGNNTAEKKHRRTKDDDPSKHLHDYWRRHYDAN